MRLTQSVKQIFKHFFELLNLGEFIYILNREILFQSASAAVTSLFLETWFLAERVEPF